MHQDLSNDKWWSLLKWPCLTSDFTYFKDDFRNKDETFPKEFYEETSTWYILDDNWSWSTDNSNNKVRINWLCAFNDTYNYVKWTVVWSQCWEWKTKNDVWRLVFRIKKWSFCTQAKTIKEEINYPKYACNIWTWKTLTDTWKIVQEYYWWDVLYLSWSTVDDPNVTNGPNNIFSDLTSLKYTCWEK